VKILLTGHNGFIGSHLKTALEAEHEVTLFNWGDPEPQVEGQDWVVHVGAISSTTERDVEKVMRQNLDFSVYLYQQCRHHGVNFQFASSASVYGLGTDFSETAPVDPRTPYAWSKYLMERYIRQVAPKNMYAQCFRYFNVYGPEGEEHKGTQASPFMQFKKQAEETGVVKIFDVDAQRDFVHISKIVDTHIRFFDVEQSGIFNVGSGSTKSFREIAELYTDRIEVIPMPANLQSSYQTYTCADMTKTNKALTKH
jgi:ADP-L-glycero-D-manno-heptose 6-epimerase